MEKAETLAAALRAAAAHYRMSGRMLPWRRDSHPYHVFLSEIMLQQTRVEAVIPYYERFLTLYPSVQALASADEQELLKAWEGLGYYSRARNLKRAAMRVTEAFGGEFPADFDALLSLPGVGRYTAGAIASIAFGLPRSAVDGNAVRIYARLFADSRPASDEAFKRELSAALDAVYPMGEDAKNTTQGLMEIGQCFCLPNGAPKCGDCPLRALCAVGNGEDYHLYPNKTRKKARRILEKTVLLMTDGERFYLRRRPNTGLLAGLWEFPSIDGRLSVDEALRAVLSMGLSPQGIAEGPTGKHIFTHLEWHMTSYLVTVEAGSVDGFSCADIDKIKETYPIASAFRTFLDHIESVE